MTLRFVLVLFLTVGAFGKDLPKAVHVDCAKAQTINAALNSAATNLIVEFSGICVENVVISRDDVTLRGITAVATISGAVSETVPGAGVLVDGASRVTLENFTVDNGTSHGIEIRSSNDVRLGDVVATSNRTYGLFVSKGASVQVRNSSFSSNGYDGISVWQDSSLTVEGTIDASGNGRVGILISGSSDLVASARGVQATANDNGDCGYALQLGASAQWQARDGHTVIAIGNTYCGVAITGESVWAGKVATQNSVVCVEVDGASLDAVPSSTMSGCGTGLYADPAANLTLHNPVVSGNEIGMILDGATATVTNATVNGNTAGDVQVQFGARATFGGVTNVEVSRCDGTVLLRGDVLCPSPAIVKASREGRRVREPRRALEID